MTSKAKSNNRYTVASIVFVLFIAIVTILSLANPKKPEDPPNVLATETESTSEELEYWYSVLQNNPSYQDAWIRIFEIERENGNMENALFALNNGKLNNPNDERILVYEKEVANQ